MVYAVATLSLRIYPLFRFHCRSAPCLRPSGRPTRQNLVGEEGQSLFGAHGEQIVHGRPAGPDDSLEFVLDKYAEYDAWCHQQHQNHRVITHFLRYVNHSRAWRRHYWESNNLPWPLLPTTSNVLVVAIWGRLPDLRVTWCNEAVYRTLGTNRAELIDAGSALDLLVADCCRQSAGASSHLAGRYDQLKSELFEGDHIARLPLIHLRAHRGQARVAVDLVIRYTGQPQERFLWYAEPTAEPPARVDGAFNVVPGIVYEPLRLRRQ